MNLRKIIPKRIRHEGNGISVAGDVNAAVAANVREESSATHVSRSTKTTRRHPMDEKQQTSPQLSKEELEAQAGEELPDREAMSLVNANLAVPVNAAVAAKILSNGSIAYADAEQEAPIDQGNSPEGGPLRGGEAL